MLRKKRRAKSLVPKRLGKSMAGKGPARDSEHLAKVRLEDCLFCQRFGPNEAHHVRMGLRTMGVRKSDYLAVPLCKECHRMLHEGKEEHFWNGALVNPIAFIRSFSEEGRRAIEALKGSAP